MIRTSVTFLVGAVILLPFQPSLGFCQASFYQGKTITVVQIVGAGGTGDVRRRALFHSYRSTSRETRRSFPITCQEAAAAKRQIIFTVSPNRTV